MSNISSDELINGAKVSFQNKLDDGLSEGQALENVIDNVVNELSNLDLPPNFLTECPTLLINSYKDAINEGHPALEALDISIGKLYFHMNKYIFKGKIIQWKYYSIFIE